MKKLKTNVAVGDTLAPPLRQPALRLKDAADRDGKITANALPKAGISSKSASLATTLRPIPSPTTCVQTLWFSFFFDGTGNNLDADLQMQKHSNVTKLYRVHRGIEDNGTKKSDDCDFGVYRIYVPGVGTYFSAVGDDGERKFGGAAGDYGTERLKWALDQFDEKIKKHIALAKNPANSIVEVNVAVFGFSRGAALSRAFIHDFVNDRCTMDASTKKWTITPGKIPARIRFMGLFDTVASVGIAMSANNMEKLDALNGNAKSHISRRTSIYRDVRPSELAFAAHAKPGADPAPGNYDGHLRWGGRLEIPEMVEEVRHFIAGHEIRNSFPVDSISILGKNDKICKPSNWYEYVYPGVHSDVGGSYRPGEGGKNEHSETKLGLIPLWDMYKFAQKNGVPLLPVSAWMDDNSKDFLLGSGAVKDYSSYLNFIKISSLTVGNLINAHMKLYYEWRFHSIHKKMQGDRSEAERIEKSDVVFRGEIAVLQKEIDMLQSRNLVAQAALNTAKGRLIDQNDGLYARAETDAELSKIRIDVENAKQAEARSRDALQRAKAKMQALPHTSDLVDMIELYDKQLMLDAQAIYSVIDNPKYASYKRGFQTGIESLRPHYKVLIEAYRKEYFPKVGEQAVDPAVISFFDNYVHDSLAGFGKDGTLPSDPRVVYVGGDEKLEYAQLDIGNDTYALNGVV